MERAMTRPWFAARATVRVLRGCCLALASAIALTGSAALGQPTPAVAGATPTPAEASSTTEGLASSPTGAPPTATSTTGGGGSTPASNGPPSAASGFNGVAGSGPLGGLGVQGNPGFGGPVAPTSNIAGATTPGNLSPSVPSTGTGSGSPYIDGVPGVPGVLP
jgi:hypothetical protein